MRPIQSSSLLVFLFVCLFVCLVFFWGGGYLACIYKVNILKQLLPDIWIPILKKNVKPNE